MLLYWLQIFSIFQTNRKIHRFDLCDARLNLIWCLQQLCILCLIAFQSNTFFSNYQLVQLTMGPKQ